MKSEPTNPTLNEIGPFGAFKPLIKHWNLFLRLARREIEGRYKGSLGGIFWAFVTPLMMLAVYSFVFTIVFQAKWGPIAGAKGEFALILFSGLIVFTLFSECISRAPSLLLENVSYIKRVVFPLSLLPWITLFGALFNAFIALCLLVVAYLIVLGTPPITLLVVPLIMLPLALFTLGVSFFLSATGMFIRDLKQIVSIGITILMFMSPIFYPIDAVPEKLRVFLKLNPLTPALEMIRAALFQGMFPYLWIYSAYLLLGIVSCWVGHWWFVRTRKGFADVV